MEQIFEQISLQIRQQVAEIKMTDFDCGQLDVLDQNMVPAVTMPCALLDINYDSCEDIGNGEQEVNARITVRLAFRVPYATDNLTDSLRRTKALELMRIIRKVYKALQGWGNDEISTLSRVRQTSNNRYPGVKVVDLEFSTTFIDL